MSLDDKLAEADEILRGLRHQALTIAARAFDPELAEMERDLERARTLLAEARLEVQYLRERLE